MTIFFSNFFLIFTIFFSKNFYIFYLKNKDFKNKSIILSFISMDLTKSFVLSPLSSKDVDLFKQIDIFKPIADNNLAYHFPQKNKNLIPIISKNSTKLIEDYYPKALLRVKQNLVDVKDPEITVFVFEGKKILSFTIFCLFSFFIFKFLKNKIVLKQKLNPKLFKKIDFFWKKDFILKLKKDFILKLKERFFSKLLDYLKNFSQNQVGVKLKSLQKISTIVLTSSTYSVSALFINDFIYMDKVEENREENTFTLSCKHYFLDIKKNDIVVVTRDFPTLFLYAGMKGIVDRVVIHQRVEITFFTTANLPEILPKIFLKKYQTSLVKKDNIFF